MVSNRLRYVVSASVLLVGLFGAAGTTAALGQDRHDTSQVYVVQGVPGAEVDVTVDGKEAASQLGTGKILRPLELAGGRHSITFTSADWKVSSSFVVDTPSLDVVLHWPADVTRRPEVTVYANNLDPVARDKARVTIAHTAVVPPADVRVDQTVLFSNIANGEFVSSQVGAGTYSVDIVPTGESGDPLLGPLDVKVRARALTSVFAIGQPKDGSMSAVVQVLPLQSKGSPAPGEIDAGSAGLAASDLPTSDAAGSGGLLPAGVLGGGLGLGLLLVMLRRRVRS